MRGHVTQDCVRELATDDRGVRVCVVDRCGGVWVWVWVWVCAMQGCGWRVERRSDGGVAIG